MKIFAKRMAVLREHIRTESEHDMDALLEYDLGLHERRRWRSPRIHARASRLSLS
jgi:hypothetical protein